MKNIQENKNLSEEQKKELKSLKLIVLGVVILQLVGMATYVLMTKDNTPSSDTDSSSLLPIWVAVFIPIIAAQNNRKKEMSFEKKKMAMYIVLGLSLLLTLGIGVFILVS
jgi:hypothetical protein